MWQLLQLVERIESFPVTSPIVKFLTGMELLLEKAQVCFLSICTMMIYFFILICWFAAFIFLTGLFLWG